MCFILFVCFCFVFKQSAGQQLSVQDSLKFKFELKRKADSTRMALRRIAIQKRQDSIKIVIQLRQAERLRKADSTRVAKRKAREAMRKQNKEYTLRKKTREQVRDSIAKASKKAAAARKAYKKKQKKLNPTLKKKPITAIVKKKKIETNKVFSQRPKKEVVKKKIAKTKKRKKRRQDISIVTKNKKEKKEKVKLTKPKIERKKKVVVKKKKLKKEIVKKKPIKKEPVVVEPVVVKKKKIKIAKRDSVSITKTPKSRIESIYPDSYKPPIFTKRVKEKRPPTEKQSFFGFQFGQSNYLGDLGGGSKIDPSALGDLDFKQNTFFYGFSFTHMRKEAIGLRLSYVFGKIAASDKNTYYVNSTDPSYARYIRNLDFQTNISEGSLMFEFHPFKFLSYKSKLHNSYLQPYALIGIGRYSFNPQGSIYDPILEEDVWIDLHPLSLEGQGMTEHPDRTPYKLSQWNLPYGFGFNYEISRTITVGLEYVGRILNTDYLDDVSTNYIDPTLFDTYLNADNAELAKVLNNKSNLIDANRQYKPGQQRGNINNNDFYFSLSGRLIINLSRNKKKNNPSFKYDDYEICE